MDLLEALLLLLLYILQGPRLWLLIKQAIIWSVILLIRAIGGKSRIVQRIGRAIIQILSNYDLLLIQILFHSYLSVIIAHFITDGCGETLVRRLQERIANCWGGDHPRWSQWALRVAQYSFGYFLSSSFHYCKRSRLFLLIKLWILKDFNILIFSYTWAFWETLGQFEMNGLPREMIFQNIFYFYLWLPSILIIDWDGHNSKQFPYNIYEIVGRE